MYGGYERVIDGRSRDALSFLSAFHRRRGGRDPQQGCVSYGKNKTKKEWGRSISKPIKKKIF
jgi:hypothetical protein